MGIGWWIAIFACIAAVAGAVLVAVRPGRARGRRALRGRFRLEETNERLPLVEAVEPTVAGAFDAFVTDAPGEASARPNPLGRIVNTPNGEAVLTTPPFTLRESVFSRRKGRYINRLMLRLPAWVGLCIKARLDGLLTPTAPDGRDLSDWREWRRRVRWRSVDVVLVDRRTWRPLVAMQFDHPPSRPIARALGGDADRIVDEVLAAAGLPLLRISGEFERDWPMIRPYVETAILPGADHDRQPDVRATPIGPEEAASLLRDEDDRDGR